MTSTKVRSYTHSHVVFNMRQNENKSLRASLCCPITSVTLIKIASAFFLSFLFFGTAHK